MKEKTEKDKIAVCKMEKAKLRILKKKEYKFIS